MVKYPASIDTEIELPTVIDNVTPVGGTIINNLRNAILAIEAELGVKPSGIYSNVRSRINALEIAVSNITGGGGGNTVVFGGDLASPTSTTQTVIGIQGRPVNDAVPLSGDVYVWSGSEWAPGASFTPGGDLSGSVTSQTVIALQGHSVANTAPTDAYVLTWEQSSTSWKPKAIQVTSVQNGGNYGGFFDIIAFSNITSTSETTFVSGGIFEFDKTAWTAANGTRTIKLRVIAQTTGPEMTIELFNSTADSTVTGSSLTTTSTTPVALTTGDLSANLTNGNAIYIVQIKMAGGGTVFDQVILNSAVLKIEWS